MFKSCLKTFQNSSTKNEINGETIIHSDALLFNNLFYCSMQKYLQIYQRNFYEKFEFSIYIISLNQ